MLLIKILKKSGFSVWTNKQQINWLSKVAALLNIKPQTFVQDVFITHWQKYVNAAVLAFPFQGLSYEIFPSGVNVHVQSRISTLASQTSDHLHMQTTIFHWSFLYDNVQCLKSRNERKTLKTNAVFPSPPIKEYSLQIKGGVRTVTAAWLIWPTEQKPLLTQSL